MTTTALIMWSFLAFNLHEQTLTPKQMGAFQDRAVCEKMAQAYSWARGIVIVEYARGQFCFEAPVALATK